MTIKKLLTYTTVVTTIIWSVGLFALPMAVGAAVSGDLIKLQCATGAGVNDPCKAVYYLGANAKRYVFPDEKTYKTWYPDFSGVMTVSSTEMSSYAIGGNVTYRPGVKMVKITTDPKVYAVSANGTLNWVTTGEIAEALYGATWNKMVQDVPDAFFVNYTVGSDIVAASGYDKAAQTSDASSINVDKNLAGGGSSAGTGLTVALASDTPASGLAICTAIRVPFTKVNLTASTDGDIVVDSLTVERAGVASDSNIGSLAIIDAATNVQIGLNQNINSSHRANFNNDFTIPAGTTRSIILAANMNPATPGNCTGAAGNVPSLSLVSVTPKGSVAVIGSLPVTGNYQTINGVTLGTPSITRGAFSNATTTVKVGSIGYIFASLKISADSTENQKVKQVKFYNAGTAALETDLENWKVYEGNITQVPATVTIDGKYITLNFTTPVEIEKGKNKEFTFKADVASGSTRTVKLVVYRDTDIVVEGATYGQAKVPTYTGTMAQGTGEVLMDNTFTISSGTMRVDSNSTVVGAQNVAFGDSQTLGSWSFVVAGEPVQITQLILAVSSTTADSEQFDNVKLVDGNGSTLMGPSSSLTNGSVTFSETIEIPIGTTVVKVVADMETQNSGEDFVAGDTFHWSITPSSITATGVNTTESVVATPSAAVTAATQTFKGATLAITRNALPTAGNVVLGQQDFKYASWNFDTTASGEDIRITVIKVGNRAATTTNVDNLTLYDMSKTSASTCTASYPSAAYDTYGCAIEIEDGSAGTSTFTLTDPMVIPKNTQRTIELRGDVRTTAASYAGHKDEFMLYVSGGATTNVITATGVVTNNAVTPTGSAFTEASAGALITITSAGTLTVNTAASIANSLVAVNSTVEMSRIKLTATNEDVDVEELALCIGDPSDTNGSETGDANDVTEFKVYKSTDMSNAIITGNIGSGNDCRTFTLTKGTVVVPKDSSAGITLVVKGTMSDIGTGLPGLAGADINVGIGGKKGIKGTGKASSTTAGETYTAATSSLFKLVMAYPTVSLNTLPATSGLGAGKVVADITVSNPTANPVGLFRLSFEQVTSTDADLGVTKAKVITQSDGKTVAAEATCAAASLSATASDCTYTGTATSFYTFVMQDPDDSTQTQRAYRIGAGESVRFQVVATQVSGADTTADGSVSFYLGGDNATSAAPDIVGTNTAAGDYLPNDKGNFVWSDLWSNDAYDAASGNATETNQWWNGYLVSGLSSASSTSQVIDE